MTGAMLHLSYLPLQISLTWPADMLLETGACQKSPNTESKDKGITIQFLQGSDHGIRCREVHSTRTKKSAFTFQTRYQSAHSAETAPIFGFILLSATPKGEKRQPVLSPRYV